MRAILGSAVILMALSALTPQEGAAQSPCLTPEGCRNDPDTQVCTSPEASQSAIYEHCEVVATYCQLSGPCENVTLLDLPVDTKITPAGTYIPSHFPTVGRHGSPLTTCKGWVVASADPLADAPEQIMLADDE